MDEPYAPHSQGLCARSRPRMRLAALATVFVVAFALEGCRGADTDTDADPQRVAGPPSGRLILNGVTIVDPRSGQLAPGMSVLMQAGKIAEVAPAGALAALGAQVVDAHGKFVIPGLLDMHTHVLGHGGDPTSNLALLLANGITGFRQMAGSPELLAARRAGTLPLSAPAPAALQIPGSPLTPLNAWDSEAAIAAVREQKAQGADFVKCCASGGEVFRAAVTEGRKTGIPVLGHVPAEVDVLTAAKLGYRSIEHLGPSPGILVACSADEAALMQDPPKLPGVLKVVRFLPFAEELFERLLRKMVVNTVLIQRGSETTARLRRVIATFDEAKCRRVAAELAAHDTWVVPTLVRIRSSRLADDPRYASNPNLQFVAAETNRRWREVTEDFKKKVTAEEREVYRALYDLDLRLVKLLDEAGVKMLAGSDGTGAGWLVPGFALHEELDQLAAAGIAPLRVLQMATLNGAEYLGRSASMGTVEVGKDADLVLISANPIESVQALHDVHAVVRAGHYLGPEALESLKQGAASSPGES